MSNQLQFRSGQVQLVKVRVNADTVIEAGDLLFLDTDDAKPASDFTWDTDLATTQTAFAEVFLGIAHQPSAAGETDPISVDISPLSIYEYDVQAGTYEVGDELGADENSSALMDQQLETANGSGIARAMEFKANSSSRLRVSFASAYHPASANVNAQIG